METEEGSRLLDSSDSSSSGPDIVETFDLIGEQDDADNPFLHWSEVLQEEQDNIATRFAQTHETHADGSGDVPFTLAFSGGGIRAAAFQAGVLWKLAELGKLKDVDYLTAVSGGGYIASAYASQVVAHGSPASNEKGAVKRWYEEVVAATLVRMQANAGNFVRDYGADWMPEGSYERSGFVGWLPRCCDCGVLVVILTITLLVNPVAFIVLLLIPMVEFVELFFGAAMRAAICTFDEAEVAQSLKDYSIFLWLEYTVVVLLVLALTVFIASKICPVLKPGEKDEETGYQEATFPYMVTYGLKAFLARFAGALFFLALLISFAVILERLKFCISEALNLKDGEESYLVRKCNEWVGTEEIPGTHSEHGDCSALGNEPWYDDPGFMNQTLDGMICDATWLESPGLAFTVLRWILEAFGEDLLGAFTAIILLGFVVAVLLLPVIPSFMSRCVALLGPSLIFVILLEFVQWRVYGAMLNDKLFGGIPFNLEAWGMAVAISCILAAIMIVIYSELRAIQHIYYRRCLQNNFLAGGKDIKMQALANPWCPLLLLTGTVSDFTRPGDTSEHPTISEISFTQLHEGSVKTGFTRTPEYETLGKAMALSGAGCLDAIGFSLSHQGRMRFWTEALNLTWGDYILFHDRSLECTRTAASMFGRWEGECLWFMRRMPAMVLMVIAYILICIASIMSALGERPQGRCLVMKLLWTVSLVILLICAAGSFFSFFFRPISFSPVIRGMHQLTSYFYTGNVAPPLLYVTDGGAVDCVTLLQLVTRKCKRILLVLANADPQDDLSVVKVAVKQVLDKKLASFFDPQDPSKDIQVLFDQFKKDKEMLFLHVGIAYGWKQGEQELGSLILMKNRLRPSLQKMPIPPLMTTEEIRGLPPEQEDIGIEDARWESLTQEQLGGLCCCDNCHLLGCNCGQKFPHLTGANYLYLTPQLFNCLARLGYRETGPAIEALLTRPLRR